MSETRKNYAREILIGLLITIVGGTIVGIIVIKYEHTVYEDKKIIQSEKPAINQSKTSNPSENQLNRQNLSTLTQTNPQNYSEPNTNEEAKSVKNEPFDLSNSSNEVEVDILGKWNGEWSNEKGAYFKFVLDLKEDNFGDIKGEIKWKLVKSPRASEQSKLNLTAVEYVAGSYDKKSRKLKIKGTRKDDPHTIIALDTYELTLSKNGDVLEGITENNGNWKGVFYGVRFVMK